MANAQISFGPKTGLLNNAAIGEIYFDQLRPFLRGTDALVQANALSASVTTPPSTPVNGDAYVLLGTTPALQVVTYSTQHETPPDDHLSFTNTTSSGSLIIAYEANNGVSPNSNKMFGTQSMSALGSDDGWGSWYLLNSSPDTTVSVFDNSATTPVVNNNPNWMIAEFPAAFNIFDQSYICTNSNGSWELTTTNEPGCAALVILTAHSFNGLFTGPAPAGWHTLFYTASETQIQGTLTSGTFVDGETITQTGTGASTSIIGTGTGPMSVNQTITGTPNAVGTWVGATSHAVYTPTSLPVAGAWVAIFYQIVTTPGATVVVNWPQGQSITTPQFTLNSFNTSPAKILGSITSGGTATVTNVEGVKSGFNTEFTITANNTFTGGQIALFEDLTNASFLNGGTYQINDATSTQFTFFTTTYLNYATVTEVAISSSLVTMTANNTFASGDYVTFVNLEGAFFLNGMTFTVASADSTSFTFNYFHADYGPTSEPSYQSNQASAPAAYPSTAEPAGAEAIVGFGAGEPIQQYNTQAIATASVLTLNALFLSTPASAIGGGGNGTITATDQWYGKTNGAVFTPTALPTATPYQNSLSGTGVWANKLNKIAVWSTQVTVSGFDTLAPAWDFYTPKAGWIIWVDDVGSYLRFDGNTWVALESDFVQTHSLYSQNMDIPAGTFFTVTQKDRGGASFVLGTANEPPSPYTPAGGGSLNFTANTNTTNISAYNFVNIESNYGISISTFNTVFEGGSLMLNAQNGAEESTSCVLNPNFTVNSIQDVEISAPNNMQLTAGSYYGGVTIEANGRGGILLQASSTGGIALDGGASGVNIIGNVALAVGYQTVTAPTYTIGSQREFYTLYDSSFQQISATLPQASSVPVGTIFHQKKIDASPNKVVILTAGNVTAAHLDLTFGASTIRFLAGNYGASGNAVTIAIDNTTDGPPTTSGNDITLHCTTTVADLIASVSPPTIYVTQGGITVSLIAGTGSDALGGDTPATNLAGGNSGVGDNIEGYSAFVIYGSRYNCVSLYSDGHQTWYIFSQSNYASL
jgi:hypothetical protein